MDAIRQYILSVVAAALICSIASKLITAKGAYGAVLKLISGLFLTVTIISPLTNIQLSDTALYFDELSAEAESIASSGKIAAEKERRDLVKKNLDALILDKAGSLNVDITADVALEGEQPVPKAVKLSGTVSPYTKQLLTYFIEENLGIAEEDQIWM